MHVHEMVSLVNDTVFVLRNPDVIKNAISYANLPRLNARKNITA